LARAAALINIAGTCFIHATAVYYLAVCLEKLSKWQPAAAAYGNPAEIDLRHIPGRTRTSAGMSSSAYLGDFGVSIIPRYTRRLTWKPSG
jgi:hypothetical protein